MNTQSIHPTCHTSPISTEISSWEILGLDKPKGWTSFDVVKKVRHLLGIRKIGHAGTLDPLATGLLILCLGKATKKVKDWQQLPKTYETTIKLGEERPSYDLETDVSATYDISHINAEAIQKVLPRFTNTYKQTPPPYSAVKHKGQRAYALARAGKKFVLSPTPVHVYALVLEKIALPFIDLSIKCSKGTYIRSLAHDIGKALGIGACVHELRRNAIGDFHVSEALSLSALEAQTQHLRHTR